MVKPIGHADVTLGLRREPDKHRTIVFAPIWFVDATGLSPFVCIAGRSVIRNCNDIYLLPDIQDENGNSFAEMALPGQAGRSAKIPQIGGVTPLTLPPFHDVVLHTERIAASETFGTPCQLVSLLPGLLLYNSTKNLVVTFRQQGIVSSKHIIEPGKKGTFFWHEPDPQKLEFAVGNRCFSPPFEVSERTVGAYPIAVGDGLVVCVKIGCQNGVFSATIDTKGCHEVRNLHPSLVAEIRPDGDRMVTVVAGSGESMPFASSRPFERGHTAVLVLRRRHAKAAAAPSSSSVMYSTGNVAGEERITLNLRRSERLERRIDGLYVSVTVATTQRVCIVTLRPASFRREALVESQEIMVSVGQVSLSVVGERPRCEYSVWLEKARLSIREQREEDIRNVGLEIGGLQIDRLHPSKDVLLASTKAPILHINYTREDCNASYYLYNSAELRLGELEVAVTDEIVREIMQLILEMMPAPPGMRYGSICERAELPYHISCQEPPQMPRTLELRSLIVGDLSLFLWAKLSVFNAFLPRFLMQLTRLTGLGAETLQLDGVSLSFSLRRFFQSSTLFGRPDPPFYGSFQGLFKCLLEQYLPEFLKCWRSMMQNSNIVFRGIFTRQFWLPKPRQVKTVRNAVGWLQEPRSQADAFERFVGTSLDEAPALLSPKDVSKGRRSLTASF